jgi:hypothetical protein
MYGCNCLWADSQSGSLSGPVVWKGTTLPEDGRCCTRHSTSPAVGNSCLGIKLLWSCPAVQLRMSVLPSYTIPAHHVSWGSAAHHTSTRLHATAAHRVDAPAAEHQRLTFKSVFHSQALVSPSIIILDLAAAKVVAAKGLAGGKQRCRCCVLQPLVCIQIRPSHPTRVAGAAALLFVAAEHVCTGCPLSVYRCWQHG